MSASAFYVGEVVHVRAQPARHRLRYRVFMGLFDLDELPTLNCFAFGYNRPGLISFHDRDHGDGSGRPLRGQIEAELRRAGIEPDGGAVRILCMPRVLGYVFNPLSVYFCYDRAGRLVAIAHEVNNTFGERHLYVLPADRAVEGRIEQACEKSFRVSPFLALDMCYRFSIEAPGERASVFITAADRGGPMLTAWFKGKRRPFSALSILRLWLAHPALTLKVILAIHWEALWIWLKLKRAETIRRRENRHSGASRWLLLGSGSRFARPE